jgi:hypothetical protein
MKIFTLVFLYFSSQFACAFGLSDHKRVTLQAVSEFNACFAGSIDSLSTDVLWMSDLDEDLNVIRKDLFYSHYYNPEKPLKMFRYDSSVRVKVLTKEIEVDDSLYGRYNDFSLTDLGHLIHHVQDMAAPPHVVPVSHGLTDGFEQNTEVSGEISSGLSCDDIKHLSASYTSVHQQTAQTTLNKVRSSSFWLQVEPLTPGGQIVKALLSVVNFWSPSSDTSFGEYGILGNVYGQSHFTIADKSYTVSPDFYQEFKRQQLKLAVQGSLRSLALYYLKN